MKQIILNADDFGRHTLINRAVERGVADGVLRSATLMPGGVAFDDAAANRLALFAPEATVNTIADFKVVGKRHLTLPDEIAEVFRCPNANCASHGEPVKSRFYVKTQNGQTRLKCHYCEKTYSRDSVAEA